MKREGFISVLALLIMNFILVNCVFIFYLVTLQTQIVLNSHKNIQTRIISDENVNRLFYDKNNLEDLIIPEIYKILRSKKPPYNNIGTNGILDGNKISIPSNSKLSEHIKSANIRLQGSDKNLAMSNIPKNFDELTNMIVNIEVENEGIGNYIEVKGRCINNIFEIIDPYICESKMLEYNLANEFNNLILLLEEEIFEYDPKGTSSYMRVNLEGDGFINEDSIIEILDNIQRSYGHKSKNTLLCIKASGGKRPEVEVKFSNDSINNKNTRILIRGNIYCEGDLIISSPFELDGNLIINQGNLIVKSDTEPIIKGKVIYNGHESFNPESISFETEKRSVYLYGSYLPGFLDVNIDVIKNK